MKKHQFKCFEDGTNYTPCIRDSFVDLLFKEIEFAIRDYFGQ